MRQRLVWTAALALLCASCGARLARARPLIAIDPEPAKRSLAQQLGATHTIDPTHIDVVDEVEAITVGAMADYVLVAVGHGPVIEQSYELVATTGALVIVGMPATGVTTQIDPGIIAARNQRILGSKMGSSIPARDIPALVDDYDAGQLELDTLVSRTFEL